MVLEVTPAVALERIERMLGLKDDDLAQALDVNARSVARWRGGDSYPQREIRRRLSDLFALAEHLQAPFNTLRDAIVWLNSESRYLGGLKPVEAIRAGRAERVEAALEALDAGVLL